MTSLIPRPSAQFPDLLALFESGWPFSEHHPARIEEFLEQDRYTVRAELPGLDPAKDIEVTTDEGQLTISAHRRKEEHANGHSEFSYGSFTRRVPLPRGADLNQVKASYDNGILQVEIPVLSTVESRRVEIAHKETG